jgi:hypothetical protein
VTLPAQTEGPIFEPIPFQPKLPSGLKKITPSAARTSP